MNANTETVERATPYEQLGGEAGIRRLVQVFYDDMEASPEATALRSMHAADLGPMRQTLFEFLSGWLGGPRTYFEHTNAKCMMSAHASLPISSREAEQWLRCMRRALQQMNIGQETRAFIDNAFTRVCNAMVNR
jgi:hemoglobin